MRYAQHTIRLDRNLRVRAVIPCIQASVVEFPVHPEPISLIDSSSCRSSRTNRECRHNLQPTVLRTGNLPDFFRYFSQVLVLAENHGDIKLVQACHSNHVQANSDVSAFFLSRDYVFLIRAVGQGYVFNLIAQLSGCHRYTNTTHTEKAPLPIPIPRWVSTGIR